MNPIDAPTRKITEKWIGSTPDGCGNRCQDRRQDDRHRQAIPESCPRQNTIAIAVNSTA